MQEGPLDRGRETSLAIDETYQRMRRFELRKYFP